MASQDVISYRDTPVPISNDDFAAVEALKQLKARYCRLLDTKDLTGWRGLFADDVVFHVDDGTPQGLRLEGADAVVAATLSARLESAVTVHHCHTHEIELTGTDSARGVWAMADVLVWPAGSPMRRLEGYGHYHETYVRHDGRWYIQTLSLTRLHTDVS